MHDHGIPIGHGHYTLVNLIALEGSASLLEFSFSPHARPPIGVDDVGIPHRFLPLMRDADPSPVCLCLLCDFCVRLVSFGTFNRKRKRELLRGLLPFLVNVAAATEKSDLQAI